MKKLSLGSLACASLLLAASPAYAIGLEEAGVERGEVEVEYEGSYTDDNTEGAYEHEHELEVEIGLTDWLKLGLGIGFEEEEGERDFEFSEIEASATIELVDPEKSGFGFALYAGISNEFAAEADDPDEKEYKLGAIAEKEFGKWLFRGNLFYISDIDAEDDEKFDGVEYAYQAKYTFSETWALGLEGYGSHKDLDDPAEDDVDEHKLGPVIYYSRELEERGRHAVSMKDDDDDGDDEEEGLEFEASAGLLFGVTDDTPDLTVKWNLGLEF